MSALDLRALLADASQSGAYFVDVRDREALSDAANELDFAVAAVDFAGCRDKREVLERFALALRFPEWFGNNWDALADCLGDLSWWEADGYVLLLDHAGAWRSTDATDFATLVDILNDVARQWAEQGQPFWALIALSAEALEAIE